MTDPDDAIVGKSTEEIEQDSSNRVNSSVQSGRRHDGGGPLIVPGAVAGGAGSVSGLGAGLPGMAGAQLALTEVGRYDEHSDEDRGSSEE